MISFGTDVADLILQRTLYDNTVGLNSSIERMTSGYKVNHAKDNAANFSIITGLNTQISSMLQVQQNAEDGLSMLQTAEGGLAEIEELLQRLRALATQASNGNYGAQSREAMQAEADEIIEQIAQIRESMKFNGMNVYYTPREEEVTTTSIGEAAVNRLAGAVRIESKNSNKSENLIKETYIQNPAGGGNTSASASSYSTTNASGSKINTTSTQSTNKTTASAPTSSQSAETPSVLSLIEGAFDFSASETRTVTIDGVEYTVTNRQSVASSLSYTKDTTTGQITFFGNNFGIRGQADVAHNLIISGANNYIYGGELEDVFTINSNSSGNIIYGRGGDDEITAYSNGSFYGNDGNDTFNTYTSNTNAYAYGGNGDDVFNINSSGSFYGESGNDTFSISGNNVRIYGGDDDDTMTLVSGTNNKIDGGAGTNKFIGNADGNTVTNAEGANAFAVTFASRETKTVEINGANYTITNRNGTENTLAYSISPDGVITFSSSAFDIVSDRNVRQNVVLNAGNIYFYGSDLDDTIEVTRIASYTRIYSYDGNDNITLNGTILYAYGGDGNDYINVLGNWNYIYGEEGDDTIDLSTSANSAYGGDGDDTINILQNINANSNAIQYASGGEGNDNINVSSGVQNVIAIGGGGTNTISDLGGNTFKSGFSDITDNAEFITLNGNETQTIQINGINYTIRNRGTDYTEVAYSYNSVTGEITFGAQNVDITAQEDAAHNVILYGNDVYFYGGNLADTIVAHGKSMYVYGNAGDDYIVHEGGFWGSAYGGDGDDTIYRNTSQSAVYGENGNDTLINNADFNPVNSVVNGGAGNDTYEINVSCNPTDDGGDNIYNVNTDNSNITGGSGNDTFYVSGNNNTINGAGGNDYYVITGSNNESVGGTGTNYYIDIGQNNSFINVFLDPNSHQLIFSYQGEVQRFTINGKTYTVTNNAAGSNTLNYSFNPNTGIVGILGSQFTIDAESNQAANLEIRGDNNVINGSSLADNISVEQGSNNVINGLSGNDKLTSESENNSLNGGNGNDTITLNASSNQTITGGAGNDIFNINSDNNTNINAGEGNNEITIEGSQNNVTTGSGNNEITINNDSNTITAGDGNNDLVVNGSNNTLTAGSGNNSVGVQGGGNNVNVENAAGDINILGNNNTFNNTRGENDVVIQGDGNSYTTTIGGKDITVTGNDNEILTGSGNDEVTLRGDGNSYETIAGDNEISIRGDGNSVQGGNGADQISINGDNNIANGGDTNDHFLISSGNHNTIDGEAGDRNTMINNGYNTIYRNVVDITPRPFEVNIKVDIGSGSDKFIGTQISFNLFDFSVDFTSQESALESLEDIDSLIKDVQEQLLNIGTTINRLETVIEAQGLKMNNLISTRSTLRDADVAEESSNYIRYQILQQASATLMSTSRGLRSENILGLIGSVNV